jgi:hypothetical protein
MKRKHVQGVAEPYTSTGLQYLWRQVVPVDKLEAI